MRQLLLLLLCVGCISTHPPRYTPLPAHWLGEAWDFISPYGNTHHAPPQVKAALRKRFAGVYTVVEVIEGDKSYKGKCFIATEDGHWQEDVPPRWKLSGKWHVAKVELYPASDNSNDVVIKASIVALLTTSPQNEPKKYGYALFVWKEYTYIRCNHGFYRCTVSGKPEYNSKGGLPWMSSIHPLAK